MHVCLITFKRTHVHLHCFHKKCTKFTECQVRGMRGVDTQRIYPITGRHRPSARPPFTYYNPDARYAIRQKLPKEYYIKTQRYSCSVIFPTEYNFAFSISYGNF